MFALNRVADVVELFEVNQPLQPVSFSEAVYEAAAVFVYPANKIIGDANIQDTIRAIGQNIDESTCHAEILQDVDGRDKPGHDGIGTIGDRN
jgi:hypothetical protein